MGLKKHMGQYFRPINLDKKEYVCPWEIGGVAKLWEWCANCYAGIFPFLMRKSNESGGGDIHKDYATAGRWAEDRIALVGDYDESNLWNIAENEYEDISEQLVKDYNDFIGDDGLKLTYKQK
ncbi:MAG: hypothetical protein GF353_01975 [Candidatus Lokiarchaeota archaeon]|nr:hypothetical protein [Candidatus Lokiarchaeota archaeon]